MKYKIIFWISATLLGLLQILAYGNTFDNFMIVQYLDIADDYFKGDWKNALNTTWSPMYSWLLGLTLFILKPSSYWEIPCVYLVNFIIYLFALACFEFFLSQLINYHKSSSDKNHMIYPERELTILSYSLFIFTSIITIGVSKQSPDLFISAFVYLISGIILYIRNDRSNWLTFFLLGLVLGLSYLTKAAMFPLAFVFLLTGVVTVGNYKKIITNSFITLAGFFLIAGPFIIAISDRVEHLTIGGPGRVNYAWYVCNIPEDYWPNITSKTGKIVHPMKKVFNYPAIYKFGDMYKEATYPPNYDENYLYENIPLHFDLKKQLSAFLVNLKIYFKIFLDSQICLFFSLLVLFYMSERKWKYLSDILNRWILLLPATAALFMYSLVHVEERYIAPFILILWIGIFSAIRLPNFKDANRIFSAVSASILIMTVLKITPISSYYAFRTVKESIKGKGINLSWQVANELNKMGIQKGDKIASFADEISLYWARLAKAKIVSEMFLEDADEFWRAPQSLKSQIINVFAMTGATALVTGNIPDYAINYAKSSGWRRIGETEHHVYFL